MRSSSVSILKAIGIILMVLAHARFSEYGNLWINMFHMPLFFFVSGYCFKESYLDRPKDFVWKKIKGIWVPYVKWGILFLLFHNLFCLSYIYTNDPAFMGARGAGISMYNIEETIHLSISTIFFNHKEQLLGGYWFLKTLFYSSLLGFIVIKCFQRRVGLAVLGLLGVSCAMSYFNIFIPFLNISATEFVSGSIFICGYCYKKESYTISHRWWLLIISLILTTLGVRYWQMSLIDITWWKIVPYTFSAVLITIAMLEIIKTSEDIIPVRLKSLLIYVGDNTITILTWHLMAFKIVSLLIILVYGLPLGFLGSFPAIEQYATQGWFVMYVFIGLSIPMLFTNIKMLRK